MPARIRAVLDTNVIISGLINPNGPPGKILKALRDGRFILVTSPEINDEVLQVMDRPRLKEKYGLADHLFDITFMLWNLSEEVRNPPAIVASRDPDDDKFLAAAVGGSADYLVTGDIKDLLNMGEHEGIRIITPEAFLRILI